MVLMHKTHQYVLWNLPIFYLSLFKAPHGVLDSLEKIKMCFLWGGTYEKMNIHWVSWEKVVAPKDKGGLGVGSIYALNVESLREKIDQNPFAKSILVVMWRKEIPIKVLGFVWKAIQDKIPSAKALSSHGMSVLSTTCGRCGDLEDVDHILIS
uniref:Reverse transcriptase zinc-binding domain-containing protein n=1 Tax=Lactuca sativa TaxID=4236 RepID=A0A9R1UTW4_LACSA|nr:hypothetical protein LSAT_V11C800454510 [Lactuca sativa]